MAGPFSPFQQQGIGTPRLQQTELPKSKAETGGVANAVTAGVATVQEVRKQNKSAQLQSEIDLTMQGLQVFREPTDQREQDIKELEDAAAAGNATASTKLQAIRQIQQAVQQGRLPSDAAAIRLRSVVKTAINDAPEFADSFRAAARKALGFSPEAEAARRTLREPHPGRATKAQQEQEAHDALVQSIMRWNGGDYKQAEQLAVQREKAEFDANYAHDSMQIADYSDRSISAASSAAISTATQDVLGIVAEQSSANGGIYDVNAVQATMAARFAAAKAKLLAGVTDARTAGQIAANFDDAQRSLGKFVGLMSKEEQASSRIKTMAKLQTLGLAMKHPELQAWMGIPNAQAVFSVLETSSRLADNPALAQAFGYGGMAEGQQTSVETYNSFPLAYRQSMLRMFQGKKPVDTQDAKIRAYGAKQIIADPSTDEATSQELLSDIIHNSGEYTAITALDDPRVLRKISRFPALKAQTAKMLDAKMEAAAMRVLSSQQLPNLGGGLTVVGDQIEMPTYEDADRFAIEQTTAIKEYNRLVKVANMYNKAGIGNGSDTKKLVDQGYDQFLKDHPDVAGSKPKVTRKRYDPKTGKFSEVK